MNQPTPSTGIIGRGLMILFFAWAVRETELLIGTEDALFYYLSLGMFWFLFASFALTLPSLMFGLIKRWWVMRPTNRQRQAGWASGWEFWRAGLYKKVGYFLGVVNGNIPLFCDIESSGLVLSPAGGGKTTSFVIPALCHNALSMLVTDLKCTLAPMTAKIRRKKFKHETIFVNPAGHHTDLLGPSARYNPLIILIEDWLNPKFHQFLISDAQAIAKQLCQDPANIGENQYFRNGSRKYLVFAMVYLVMTRQKPTLTDVLALLSDQSAILVALEVGKVSSELSGDLARLAIDLTTKVEEGDKRQTESFREGAVQSLEVFGASGSLAECTSSCSFRFRDLKTKKMTIYLMADPTRQKVYAPWVGLLMWCSITELVRCPSNQRITLLLDEVCNFKLEGLPEYLTLLREFGVSMWLVVQELAQWGTVYGKDSIQTLLSQTEAKLFMQVRSLESCRLISDMLGEEKVKSRNYNLGSTVQGAISQSVQDRSQKLLSPEEIRRTDDTIAIIKGHRPIRLKRLGYHQVWPWKRQVGINPLYGKKYKGWTRLWLWR